MNLSEGTRRLALVLGGLGAIAGGVLSYFYLQPVMRQREMHKAFEQLSNSDVVTEQRKIVQSPDPYDREGRFKWKPRELKLQVLPYDDVDFSRVLDALTTRGYLVKYATGDAIYGCIPTWKSHQFINHREAESTIQEPQQNQILDACVTRAPRVDDECVTRHGGKGREGKGKEGNWKGKTKTLPLRFASWRRRKKSDSKRPPSQNSHRADKEMLRRIAKVDQDAWSNAWAMLEPFFTIDESGIPRQGRLERERREWQEKQGKAQDKARKAAKSRWKDAPSIAPSTPQALHEQCPSPSPIPIKSKDKDSSTPLRVVAAKKEKQFKEAPPAKLTSRGARSAQSGGL